MDKEYLEGFKTSVETFSLPPGLTVENLKKLSGIKNEPYWMLEYRLNAFEKFKKIPFPNWIELRNKSRFPSINFDELVLYSAPKKMLEKGVIDEEVLETFKKLGVPTSEYNKLLNKNYNIAVETVFDSVSIATTFSEELAKHGIIFCSISEAIKKHPDLVKKYLSSVVPVEDNYFAALNSACFSDGSFAYIPKNVKCPIDLSTYFRINSKSTGQFERTLIIADEGSSVSYLEGCTAAIQSEKQLHAAVVEIIALDNASVKYSTVQNWYSGDKDGIGGVLNLVTKRALVNRNSKVVWTQVETGSAITWKYPSCVLKGDGSSGEFYSMAISKGHQIADTGTKMIHIGKNSKSVIVSKSISADYGYNTYRGLVNINKGSDGSINNSKCDSLIFGEHAFSNALPTIFNSANNSSINHEAYVSQIDNDLIFSCARHGIDYKKACQMIVNGFCSDVFNHLPMEFAVEANNLLNVTLDGFESFNNI